MPVPNRSRTTTRPPCRRPGTTPRPVYYQTYYQPVYQGTSWYWSPTTGWQSYNRYVDVPYQVPTYSYPQAVPVTTTYYW